MSTSKRKVWCSLLPWHNWSAWNWRGIGTDRQYRRCVRAMRVGSRAERDPVNSIEQIRDRQDHLHAMGYAQVNGAPATEIHLAASTVRQAADDLAALLDAAEATRRVVGEAKAHGWVNVSASAMRDLYATSDRLLPQV